MHERASVPSPLTARDTIVRRSILRCREADAGAVGDALGIALPMVACRSSEAARHSALWLGPDEWLLLHTAEEPGGVHRPAGSDCSLVDVTHRQLGFVIDQPDVEEVLAAGCPLDVAEAAFPVGMCTRTLFDKVEIVLWRTGPTRFHIEVWRSFAPHLAATVAQAVRDTF